MPYMVFGNGTKVGLPLDGVIDDVKPTEDAVKDHPKNGMIDAP
jgi:hypothetical protein